MAGACARAGPSKNGTSRASNDPLIVPTLRVGMLFLTLRVAREGAERPVLHSHAERGNDQSGLFSCMRFAPTCSA
ncbi:hypothetical protein C2U56_08120 [Pseudomonas fluorescens]|nr:hypothetical protein C2U56_08120 [Pseudomonas fluorescens]